MTPEELAYYRAVEDRFGRLRGTPFLFRPKDFALVRRWWSEGVPLAAVLAGMQEVFDRRRDAGGDPVSSLSYCRHAVSRHARALAPTAVAASEPAATDEALPALAAEIRRIAGGWAATPGVAAGLEALARAVETVPASAGPAAAEETLARLEVGALEGLAEALPSGVADGLRASVAAATQGLGGGTDGPARARMERAVRLRALRELFGLPRLELSFRAPDR